MTGPVMVTMRDVRSVHSCSRGARAFGQRHGLDWNGFLQGGIDATILDATGDAMAKRIADYARKRTEAENGRRR